MPRYRMTLKVLSPIHIGTGEILSPDEFVVRPQRDSQGEFWLLTALDMPRLFAALTPPQRRRFNEAADGAALGLLRRFIADAADPARHARWQCPASEDVFKAWQRALDRPELAPAVHPMTRTGSPPRPYIPGSTIKGAIRTALIQHLIDSRSGYADELRRRFADRRDRHAATDLEAEVLGYMKPPPSRPAPGRMNQPRPEIRADPFRALRITDAFFADDPAGDLTTVEPVSLISLAGRSPADASRTEGIAMFYEMTYSHLDDRNILAHGTLAIDDRLAATDASRAKDWNFARCVSKPLSCAEIIRACQRFYEARLHEEAAAVAAAWPGAETAYEKLRSAAQALRPNGRNEALIRIGRFSHVECVTLAPPLRRAAGGKSRALAPGDAPLGWAVLRLQPVQP